MTDVAARVSPVRILSASVLFREIFTSTTAERRTRCFFKKARVRTAAGCCRNEGIEEL
jgi:hypothetical protein